MSTPITFLTAFVILTCTFVSCGHDDGPPFIPRSCLTTYTGSIIYTNNSGQDIRSTNGTATVEYIENSYSIRFTNNIPSLTNLYFINHGGMYVSTPEGVQIDEPELHIGMTLNNGESWWFNGTK